MEYLKDDVGEMQAVKVLASIPPAKVAVDSLLRAAEAVASVWQTRVLVLVLAAG